MCHRKRQSSKYCFVSSEQAGTGGGHDCGIPVHSNLLICALVLEAGNVFFGTFSVLNQLNSLILIF